MKTMKISYRRCGFTLIEMAIVTALSSVLALLLARTWYGLVKPAVALSARSRVNQEARMATASLARDLGGDLANSEGRLGPKTLYPRVGRLQPDNAQLLLCFDGGNPPNGIADWGTPDTIIVYSLQGDELVRSDQTNNTSFIVARYVTQFAVQDLGDRVQIQLTFAYRGLTQTFTLVGRDP